MALICIAHYATSVVDWTPYNTMSLSLSYTLFLSLFLSTRSQWFLSENLENSSYSFVFCMNVGIYSELLLHFFRVLHSFKSLNVAAYSTVVWILRFFSVFLATESQTEFGCVKYFSPLFQIAATTGNCTYIYT